MASLQSPIMAVEVVAINHQQRFLQSFHYLAPALVLAYFMVTTAISVCTLQNLKACRSGPRKVLVSLLSLVITSFLVEACMLLTDTAVNGAHHSSTDSNVSSLPRTYESRRQCPFVVFADHESIRFMRYSRYSSGQFFS